MSKVIINDVDVSECRYLYDRYPEGQIVKCCSLYDNDSSEFNDETVHFCSSHRNCYYKQLVKKTDECKQKDKYKQECEQKHEIIEELIRERQELQKQLRHQLDMNIAMNKECEELKTEKEVIKKYLGISDKSIMQRLEELTEYKLKRQLKYIKINEKCDRCYKALEEIEQVINNILNSCLGRDTVGCRPAHNVCGDLIKILNIVGEARGYKND